jgi:hypothetical protein
MKRPLFLLVLLFLTFGCTRKLSVHKPMPAPIGMDEEELTRRRKAWIEISHPAPPGVDWRVIESENVRNNIVHRNRQKELREQSLSIQENFANGQLQGVWSERGSNNQAGSIIAADYDSVSNKLYVISDAGSLWRNEGLQPNNWTLLNDDYRFDNRTLKTFRKSGGGNRLLVQLNGKILYSDNEGTQFTPANIAFPFSWSGNQILQLVVQKSNSNNIYALAYFWDNTSWSPRLALYRSIDEGLNFLRIYTFGHGRINSAKINAPHNANQVYVLDAAANTGIVKIQSVSGNNVTDVANTAAPETLSDIQFSSTLVEGTLHMYLMNNNNRIFHSTNRGASWALKGDLPQDSWNILEASNTSGNIVFAGGVEAMKSINTGTTWNSVNSWFEYYNDIIGKLHADIMNIAHFRKSDGMPFAIINQHGGVAISYNNLSTTTNLSVHGLRSAQYYDVLTPADNSGIIYGGTQDQGLHMNNTGTTTGLLDFEQVISGDYGYLTLADLQRTLYAEYPGASLFIFDHPSGSFRQNWTLPGTQKPNYGWMLPIKNMSNPLSDTILIGGGNINGGGGSYLCRISMQSLPPYNINATQYPYDFRANSNNNQSGITAIETSRLQPEKIYVATEDGTFFYSNNNGSSWNKSTTFSVGGGWYLYGSTILASEFNENLIWYGGSGYGGTSLFRSTDGGQTFNPMNNGLPQTLVHELAANLNESLLFAATDAGPYVYVAAEDKWYSMIGATTPIQRYTSVEYLSSTNTVRFGTYGRGIQDFALSSPIVYFFSGNGNWSDPANWVNRSVPPATLSGNNEIFISPQPGGQCILDVNQTVNTSARITLAKNRNFIINGNLNLNR